MKKLSALLLAVVFVASLGMTAFAASIETVSQFVVFDTDASTDYYNPGNTVYVNFTVGDVTLEGADGVSALDFELYYDSSLVDPVVTPSYDVQGDRCDFTGLLSSNPNDAWEMFGRFDTENSCYSFGIADFYAESLVTSELTLSVSIPFTVKSTAKVDDIVFSFVNVMAYNSDLSKQCEVSVDDVVIQYALQPDVITSLPSGVIPLDIAGYKHAANNVVYFTDTEMTVADYVSSFMDPVSGQDQMTSFAIIIAAHNGEILYSDLTDSDKSEVVIPADSFIIGIYSDNTSAIDAVSGLVGDGASVKLYNLNIESTGRVSEGTALDRAGFTVVEFETEDGADAYIDYVNKTVTVYKEKVSLADLDAMIKGDISVYDTKGAYISSSTIVGTGMTIDYLDGYTVIVLGDVNGDGKVNQFDCLVLKSHILKGIELSDAAYKAACIVTEAPSQFSYLAVKSYYFGKTDFLGFNPNK